MPTMSSRLSTRVLETNTPVMVEMQDLLRGRTNVLSLGQGIVHWQPPEEALEKVRGLIDEPATSNYGADEGLPELRAALLEKAYVNLVLALCDPGDSVVMFVPYYFNAYMAFQMTGITDIILGHSNPDTIHPDADWLEKALKVTDGKPVPKVVTVVNPGNPTGTYVPEPLLQRISKLCRNAGSWLIVDNTYEYFMYDNHKHVCVEGDHVINIFSFSKAYGMMGWRIGYIAYPSSVHGFGAQLLKVQDNIAICASIIGQKLAIAALQVGRDWVFERVKKLGDNRALVIDALLPLGEEAVKGGEGAMYFWARLPEAFSDDVAVVHWLVKRHRITVIPGTASGCPGFLRVSYGGLTFTNCQAAAARLKVGLQELVSKGMVA